MHAQPVIHSANKRKQESVQSVSSTIFFSRYSSRPARPSECARPLAHAALVASVASALLCSCRASRLVQHASAPPHSKLSLMADAEKLRLLALQSLRRKADEPEEGEARAAQARVCFRKLCVLCVGPPAASRCAATRAAPRARLLTRAPLSRSDPRRRAAAGAAPGGGRSTCPAASRGAAGCCARVSRRQAVVRSCRQAPEQRAGLVHHLF